MALNRNYSYVNLVSISAIGVMLLMFWLMNWTWFTTNVVGRNMLFYTLGFLIVGHLVVSLLGVVDYPDVINKEYDD
jgi:hypothetical protein